MNKQFIPAVPDENRIEDLLRKIQLVPSERFHQKVKQAAWRTATRGANKKRLALAMIVLFLLAILLITPQGRAVAQRIFLFFTVTEEKSFPIPTEQVFPMPATETPSPIYLLPLEMVEPVVPTLTLESVDSSCDSPEAQTGYICQMNAVEAQAGFDAKEFLYDPKGVKFSTAAFIPETREIWMEFEVITGGGYLHLRQGVAHFPIETDTWGKVPSDSVEQVSVNGLYAEIASGTFVVYPNTTSAVWEPGGQLSLAWRDGNRWFALEKLGDPSPIEWITKDELIKLAEGLVDARPPETVPPLDPEYLTTVEQAETLAGFHIPTPTLLPIGYELKRVVWTDNVVRLMYGPKGSSDNELFIFLGEISNNQVGPCTECPSGVTETVKVGPWQGWYWHGIFNMGAGSNADPIPTPVWEADAHHWSLGWNSDKFWFSMFYSPPFNSGKEMNKETLIKIAESLK